MFAELPSDAKPNIRGPEKKMIDPKNHKGGGKAARKKSRHDEHKEVVVSGAW